ncbi:MAG: hypothetical protein HC860_11245 [Alkalinema sp. RU_4_3]|nr:hypothetical protein [Alkalinema sp. RU_4_3]
MSSTITDNKRDSLVFILIAWLLAGFTGLFVLMAIGTGQVISLLVWIPALLILLPPLKRQLTVKLPFLRNRFLKVFCWFMLWVLGLYFLSLPPSVKAIAFCAELQQGVCSESSAVFKNQSKLYLSGKHNALKEGAEFTVNFEPNVGLKNKTIKAKLQKETFLLELEPSQLPVGTYKVSLAANTKVSLPEPQEFTVWAGVVDQLTLCDRPQQSACNTETTAFVEDTPTLYLSGKHNQLTEGAEFVANLTYHSEPKKSAQQQLPPVRAKVKDQQVNFEIQPKDLPIGTYDLTLTSKDKIKVNGTKTFTVWRLHEEAKAIAENKFPESRLALEKLSLCDRSKAPIPDKKEGAEPVNDQPIDETKAEKLDGKIVKQRRRVNFCTTDSDRFPTTAKRLGSN